MERSRSTTQKQRRRFDALRRTLRRQEGGARQAEWSPFREVSAETKAFLAAALAGSDFAFLTAEEDWRTGADAAKNYAMLIMRQEDVFVKVLDHIRGPAGLGLTEASTDGELLAAVIHQQMSICILTRLRW